MLDDKAVDAVWIATPDHWHAPAAILAADAGKHVYVEKPCSHNIREGRLLVEAGEAEQGRHPGRHADAQHARPCQEAMDRLHGGAIGEVLVAKAWNSQLRRNLGKVKPTRAAARTSTSTCGSGRRRRRRSTPTACTATWRFFHDFGAGDIGNDGVHDIDVGVWGLGVDTLPNRVAALGGKYFFDDDQEWPDTQYVVFEYDAGNGGKKPRQLIFEQRIWSPYVQEGYENGCAFYGTKGMLIIGHTRRLEAVRRAEQARSRR